MAKRNRANRQTSGGYQPTTSLNTSNPPGSKKQEPEMPRGLTADTFSNVLARLGFGTPNLMEGTEYPLTRITQNYQLLNSLYRNHWVIRNVVDTIPEDMTRNWITLRTDMPPEATDKIDRIWRRWRIKEKILHGLKWGRLYGGAVGLIMISGHEDILDQPLDLDMIMPGAFKNIMIIDRWTGAYPSEKLVEDINNVEFGLPMHYEITLENGQVTKVHHSRVLRFMGRQLPYWESLAEVHWGASEIEIVFEELKKRDNTSFNIAQLVFLANLRVMKMGSLGQDLAIGNEQMQKDLYNTLQAQNWLMSNMGLYVMDKEDSLETHQYTFSGLSDIYENFMLDLAGACKIPVTKLFGRSPAGLNATGESDMQNYYETVQQSQETTLSPILDKLLPIICMSELGTLPDDLDYDFNPIRTPDDKEVADLAKNKTEAITTAFTSGIISQKIALKELKQLSDSIGMFTNITDEDIEAADNSTDPGEMLPMGGDLGYGGSMGAEATNRTGLQSGVASGDEKARGILDWFRRSNRNH